MKISKAVFVFAFLLFALSIYASAEPAPTPKTGTEKISDSLLAVCTLFNTVLPIATVIGISLSGISFAIGQVAGAETRARATVWATQLLIGSVIAGSVTVLAPSIAGSLIQGVDLSQCSSSGSTGGGTLVCEPPKIQCEKFTHVECISGKWQCIPDEVDCKDEPPFCPLSGEAVCNTKTGNWFCTDSIAQDADCTGQEPIKCEEGLVLECSAGSWQCV